MRATSQTTAVILAALALLPALWDDAAPLGPPVARASDFWDEVKNPGLRSYHRNVAEGRAAAAAGRFEDALSEAETAIAAIEERPEAWILKGRALGELGRLEGATAAFERALLLDPNALATTDDGRHAAQLLAAGGRHDLAAQVLPGILGRMSASSTRVDLYALYGDVLSTLGPERLREAIAAYREAVRHGGQNDPRAALGLALSLRRAGIEDEARDLARGAGARGRIDGMLHALPIPDSERAARRAVALMAIGDQEGARRAWREASSGEHFRDHALSELARLSSGQSARRRGAAP